MNKQKILVLKNRFSESERWECWRLESALSSVSKWLVLDRFSDTSGFNVTRIEAILAETIDSDKVWRIKNRKVDSFKAHKKCLIKWLFPATVSEWL